MKSVYPIHPDCKPPFRNGSVFFCSVREYYSYFVGVLLSNPSLLLQLIGETGKDVRIIRYGTYSRFLLTGSVPSSVTSLQIQRVMICPSDGGSPYTRALLPGLVIPYKEYSLQLVLNCLSRHYAGHKIKSICTSAGISTRQMYRWIRLAEENAGLIAGFFKSSETSSGICRDLESFLSLSGVFPAKSVFEELYILLRTHAGRIWKFLTG